MGWVEGRTFESLTLSEVRIGPRFYFFHARSVICVDEHLFAKWCFDIVALRSYFTYYFVVFFIYSIIMAGRQRTSRPNTTVSFQKDRNELFDERITKRRTASLNTSGTASEAAAIQASLRRTQILLQNELERVEKVGRAIDSDGKLLEESKTDQESLNVSKAKSALTSLQRAQQREQRLLMLSVTFFWTVVFYVLWCRILIRIPFLESFLRLIFQYLEWRFTNFIELHYFY